MTDQRKTLLAVGCFLAALILPVLISIFALGLSIFHPVGEQNRNLLLLVGIAAFLIPMTISIVLFLKVKNLSWISAGFPFIASLLYSGSVIDVIPDLAPFITRVDDGAVVTLGALLSFILTQRRNPNAPKWIFIPLGIAAGYTFLGGVIPGGLDEIIVQALALLSFLYGSRQGLLPAEPEVKKKPES